jgi:RNA polymerase sigma-70 factor, ECF subfamily
MPVLSSASSDAPFDGELRSNGLPSVTAVPSFPDLYQRYFSFVWSSARRMGVREHELDDVVQDIFITVHGKVSTLKQPDSLRSWIYGITRRTVSTYHRARRTKVASAAALSSEPDMQYPRQLSPHDLAEQSDEANVMLQLLAKLEPSKREVFELTEIDEMTAPEIASAIEVPLNTVYSRLRSARQELEAALVRYRAQTGRGGNRE